MRTCRPTLICFSHLRWDFVFQRPQHLLTRAARTYAVIYFEEPLVQESGRPRLGIKSDPSGVTVLTPLLPAGMEPNEQSAMQRGLLMQFLAERPHSRRLAWYYTPMALAFTRDLAFDACVYDNMDELSCFAGAPPELLALEELLLARADLVFTGGRSLYELKKARHPDIHCFPSSIDAAHFAQARTPTAEPDDQKPIPRPRIGFFGVIDERMNMRLVEALARLRPAWQFPMIGPVAKIDPETLPRLHNLHWLGSKPYRDLPCYLAGWDAGFMPFALNESTRFISPTKTPEFLAAGLPVVSTPITDVVQPYGERGLVEIADEPEAFAMKLLDVWGRARAPWLEAVDRHLAMSSWDQTWEQMKLLLGRALGEQPALLEAAE